MTDPTDRFEADGEAETHRKVERGHYRGETLRHANAWLAERERRRRQASPAVRQSRLNALIGGSGWVVVLIMVLLLLAARCTGPGG
ncbi:MAG: hypothetical protein GWO02_15750 [Gammaproteobacteria bacterium]|nr:hypothetical protein [Gammaproteobacteria bacterium]